ncbi:MAG TPA: hypothetical protein VH143_35770 [Kofleriaceae bacterium]|nr:hypothetical protein [Kofleriaceae bacterium]
MARSSRAAPAAPVAWRDGVHLTGTPIWCDARRRRDVCFASSADRVATTGHGKLIATPTTLALVDAAADAGNLAVPLRKPFTLGTLRLELLASGRCIGAAMLHVDARGRTALYAGPIRVPEADVRACDALVVAAPFGEAHHVFRPRAEVAERVVAWVRAERVAKHVPIAVVDTPLDGLEVAGMLADAGFAVAAGKSIRDAAARLPEVGARLVAKDADVIVRTERDRIKSSAPTALIAGRAIDRHAYALGFAWPFAAGRAELLAWIEHTRAKEIFVTGPCAEAIVAKLNARGRSEAQRARVLGPPTQMTLFEAAR